VAIDNDDGSAYYQTSDNVFVFAAQGLKSDFGGRENHHTRNLYAYVGDCFLFGACDGQYIDGSYDSFLNNTCISYQSIAGYQSDCPDSIPYGAIVKGTEFYNEEGRLEEGVDICDDTFTINKWPKDDKIIGLVHQILNWKEEEVNEKREQKA